MPPPWTRLKTIFSNQLFAAAFFGAAIVLDAPRNVANAIGSEAMGKLSSTSFHVGAVSLAGSQLLPLSVILFIAAGGLFFVAGLATSLRIPSIISEYGNRGEFVSASRNALDFDEDQKRSEWTEANRDAPIFRAILALSILCFLLAYVGSLSVGARTVLFVLLGR